PWSIGIFAETHVSDLGHFIVRSERPYVRFQETQIVAVKNAKRRPVSGSRSCLDTSLRGGTYDSAGQSGSHSNVTSAILEGRQPSDISLSRIPRLLPLPWTNHRRLPGLFFN